MPGMGGAGKGGRGGEVEVVAEDIRGEESGSRGVDRSEVVVNGSVGSETKAKALPSWLGPERERTFQRASEWRR